MSARLLRDVARTLVRIARDRRYSLPAKLHWMTVNPWFIARKWINIRRALNVSDADAARYSLEAARARRSAGN
jgi:hypothetical protein